MRASEGSRVCGYVRHSVRALDTQLNSLSGSVGSPRNIEPYTNNPTYTQIPASPYVTQEIHEPASFSQTHNHTQNRQIIQYNENTLTQLRNNPTGANLSVQLWPAQDGYEQNHRDTNEERNSRYINLQPERRDNNREQERLIRIEAELKRMNSILEKVLKCVQDSQTYIQKPNSLPITSLAQMDAFENLNENDYSNVVKYFSYIGGFNLKEAVNQCFKEGFTDALASSFTWWGGHEDDEWRKRPLYNARFITAIYEAVCRNRYFEKPTRSEFQACMKEALRTAKERHRSRTRGPRPRRAAREQIRRDLWNDEREDDNENDENESND
ncbi:uncharacterized protein LOC118646786 [Monomorium pharaonis]|uniref:uncharacterized protein LOC118646786 n=1 Tax=Monomorium pharaonis TaxID=307658 RepID=UPI001746753E|nr:uncharacterized protein LOC118646786 [Monomorium pharaonis]